MFRPICNVGLAIAGLLVFSAYSNGQATQSAQPSSQADVKNNDVVSISDESSTVRVADPNELIGINGRVMRVSEFMAFLSANTSLAQHLRSWRL